MQKLTIKDHDNKVVDKIAGPYNEDASVDLVCEVEGGKKIVSTKNVAPLVGGFA